MLTSLDWLVIVFMGLAALTLLSLALMFLLKNKTAKRVFFYIVAALGVYIASIGIRIGLGFFTGQVVFGLLAALMSIGAFVVERVGRKSDKMFRIARIIAGAALVSGLVNAIL